VFLRARSQREAPVARLNQAGAFSFGEPLLLLSCLRDPGADLGRADLGIADFGIAELGMRGSGTVNKSPVAIRTILCLRLNSPLPGPLPGTSM
jgi:hypothetical protein